MSGWIGVDLDGTLAHYDHWEGEQHIGAPVPAMLERVKKWLAEGREVRIFTARVARDDDFLRADLSGAAGIPEPMSCSAVRKAIEVWCLHHVGRVLPVTNKKDYGMIELWDDRCVRVQANTGEPCCNFWQHVS